MKDGIIFPFKKTWRSRLDLEYLDETSERKVATRLDQSRLEDGANPNEIGKKLRQFTDYASKETLGQVHAGGFLHHRIVLNQDGSRTSPMALSNSERKKRICDACMKHMRDFKTSSSNPVIQHRLVFTMSTAFHDKLVVTGINPDIVLRSSLKTVLNRFQQQFHPTDSIGYAYGLHHDTDNVHAHVAICPRTAKGHYVGLSMSRTRESGNKNQMTYLMRAFDRENRKWDKLLSNPDKLRKAFGIHLESEKMAIVPKISAKQLQVLREDESLYASRLRNSYQAIQKLERELQQKRQAQRTVRVMRNIPRVFGWRKPAPLRSVEKVAGAVEKISIREMQSLLCRMKQTYREDHRIYSQRYGFQTTENDHAHHKSPSRRQGQGQLF